MITRNRARQLEALPGKISQLLGRDVFFIVTSYVLPSFDLENSIIWQEDYRSSQYPDFLGNKICLFIEYQHYAKALPWMNPVDIILSEIEKGMSKWMRQGQRKALWDDFCKEENYTSNKANPFSLLVHLFFYFHKEEVDTSHLSLREIIYPILNVWLKMCGNDRAFLVLWTLTKQVTLLCCAKTIKGRKCKFCDNLHFSYVMNSYLECKWNDGLKKFRDSCNLIVA